MASPTRHGNGGISQLPPLHQEIWRGNTDDVLRILDTYSSWADGTQPVVEVSSACQALGNGLNEEGESSNSNSHLAEQNDSNTAQNEQQPLSMPTSNSGCNLSDLGNGCGMPRRQYSNSSLCSITDLSILDTEALVNADGISILGTPLMLATARGWPGIVSCLLRFTDNSGSVNSVNSCFGMVNKSNQWGHTALHWAAKQDAAACAAILIENGADVNAKEQHERTPLHWAAVAGSLHTIGVLLDRSDLNVLAIDRYGRSACHYAAQNGFTDIAETLVRRQPTILAVKDMHGCTPADTARMKGKEETARRLTNLTPTFGHIHPKLIAWTEATKPAFNKVVKSTAALVGKLVTGPAARGLGLLEGMVGGRPRARSDVDELGRDADRAIRAVDQAGAAKQKPASNVESNFPSQNDSSGQHSVDEQDKN